MKTVKTMLLLCGLALGSLGATAAEAQAETLGVVTINNPTRSTISYQFKWGSDGEWTNYRLGPGQYRYHYYYLDADNRALAPYVRFDNGVGNVKSYHLGFYAANRANFYSGKRYDFLWSGPYVDLYSR